MVGHKFYDQQPTRAASNPHISLKGDDLILGELGFQKKNGGHKIHPITFVIPEEMIIAQDQYCCTT